MNLKNITTPRSYLRQGHSKRNAWLMFVLDVRDVLTGHDKYWEDNS